MAGAFDWKPAWEEFEDDHPLNGAKKYRLPNGHLLMPEDRFWHTEEQYLIEVTAVKTKIYRGVVGGKGSEGGDCVFYERDWTPDADPHTPRRHRPTTAELKTGYHSVESLAEMIDDGVLVPHRGNGYKLPP